MVRALEFNLTALSGISLLVGGVLVATTLATSVVQRRRADRAGAFSRRRPWSHSPGDPR